MKEIEKFKLTEINLSEYSNITGGANEIVLEVGTDTHHRIIYCTGEPEENYGDWNDEGC